MRGFSFLLICALLGISHAQLSKAEIERRIQEMFNTLPPNENQLNNNNFCGQGRECVPHYLCSDGIINKNGKNIIDIRVSFPAPCDVLDVCCYIGNITSEPVYDPVPPIQHNGCGFRNPDGVGFRITGHKDNEAQFGEFPWMVAILTVYTPIDLYICGGSLIAPNIVLTAAHCVHNRQANNLIARAGEWDTQRKNEVLPEQNRAVREKLEHEQFKNDVLFHDVALLIVESPFEWQENVRPICLPPPGIKFDFSRCFATGWGKNNFERSGVYQVILKKIELPIVPREQCKTNLRSTRLGRFFELHESFVCAGGEAGKDTCEGDGGSPLVCPILGQENRFYQTGIVAWGIGCGAVNVPGVYADVSYLRSWIDEKLTSKGVEFRYFTP